MAGATWLDGQALLWCAGAIGVALALALASAQSARTMRTRVAHLQGELIFANTRYAQAMGRSLPGLVAP